MRSIERLIDVLKTVNLDLLSDIHKVVIRASVSALEKGPISNHIAGHISDRIVEFESPHIKELLTEAVAHIEKMDIAIKVFERETETYHEN